MDILAAVSVFSERNPRARAIAREDRRGLVVAVSGHLELQASYELQNLLTQLIDATQSGNRVAIDLAEVKYISSTGVGALTAALIEADRKGVAIVFQNVSPAVLSVLDVLGLTSFLPIENTDG